MRSLNWPEVWRQRLARHWLLAPAGRTQLAQVASDVCGIHAQVMTSAELSLGLRVADVTQRDVATALWSERRLVKTYGLRGTVHLLPASELAVWLAAFQAKVPPRRASAAELEALDPARRALVIEAIRDALDGRQLTRQELQAEIVVRVGAWAAEEVWPAFGGALARWTMALTSAAHAGVMCFGPPRGNRVTYVRVDQWLGRLSEPDGRQALTDVCRRFLAAYGPATPAEFARWFYTTPAAARELFNQLAGELEEVDVEGWRAWLPTSSAIRPEPVFDGPSVLLLPHFDSYVVGCHPRHQLVPRSAPAALQKGTAAPFAVLLVDGVVGGLWQRRREAGVLRVQVEAFGPLSALQRDVLERQVARIGEILHLPGELSFGPVEPRPHL